MRPYHVFAIAVLANIVGAYLYDALKKQTRRTVSA